MSSMVEAGRFLREGIAEVPLWPTAGPLEELEAAFGRVGAGEGGVAPMDTNENPLGPSPKALDAIARELGRVNRYPDGACTLLTRAVAARLGVAEDMLVFGNGGDNCIRLLAAAFLNQGDEVVVGHPSFPVYQMSARIMGARPVPVPLRDHVHDLTEMRRRVGERTKLVLICNPNNPTGTIVRRGDLEAFLRDLPRHVLVVLDEAYFEFVSDPQYPNGVDSVEAGLPVVVLRTFSKLYGLAGLRVGYLIGAPKLIEAVRRVREPYAVSRLAQVGALAALEDRGFVERVLETNREGKAYLTRELEGLGCEVVPSHTNFLFTDFKTDAARVAATLRERGVLIRPGTGWGFPSWARVTLGTSAHNRRFVVELARALEKGPRK
ncbi:MAG: histidinol-phosphate transaminase [Spirochaetales bacterium]|nr:histidinol-phosphate transaminase [Spirochaetales bacterium]